MEFDQAVAELETLVATLEREGDERALLALELVDAIHRPALELLLRGEFDHPLARAVLSMYDLVPVDDRVRVEEALDEVRPYIESHGGEVTLIKVQDGVVDLELSGACNGCAGSAMTLRRGIETVLRERYPAFRKVVAHETAGSGGSGQLLQIETSPLIQVEGLRRPVFEPVGSPTDLGEGEMRAVEVQGISVLLLNVAGEPYAFRNRCALDREPHRPLDGGRLTGNVLVCPWHNCAYDARSGRRVDDRAEEPPLSVIPVAVQDGVLKVAVNVA